MKGATPDIYGVVLPLHGIVGSEAAQTKGFFYSKAMRESGVVWTEEYLDQDAAWYSYGISWYGRSTGQAGFNCLYSEHTARRYRVRG